MVTVQKLVNYLNKNLKEYINDGGKVVYTKSIFEKGIEIEKIIQDGVTQFSDSFELLPECSRTEWFDGNEYHHFQNSILERTVFIKWKGPKEREVQVSFKFIAKNRQRFEQGYTINLFIYRK